MRTLLLLPQTLTNASTTFRKPPRAVRRSLPTVLAIATLVFGSAMAFGQRRAQDGATVGGVAGAVIGGIIGHQNDETPEGAIIGGAVGAIAGGLLGNAQDRELERQRYYQNQAYYQQQQQAYTQRQQVVASGVSTADLAAMVRSGLSETLISSQLHQKGVQRRLEVSEIITLHQQGVPDSVITAFQQAPLATQLAGRSSYTPATTASFPGQPPARNTSVYQPQPVIVQQPAVIVREPVIYHRPSRVYYDYCPPRVRHYHSGTSIRIGF